MEKRSVRTFDQYSRYNRLIIIYVQDITAHTAACIFANEFISDLLKKKAVTFCLDKTQQQTNSI